jgi:Cu/Zn superoxide dismutase
LICGNQLYISSISEITVKILRDSNPNGICGEIKFSQQDPDSALTISGVLSGLAPGLHGFHVHQNPELGNNCVDAGPHFNPFRVSCYSIKRQHLVFLVYYK